MTIALAITTREATVLASDSASSLSDQWGVVVNVYNNASKVFHLYKGLPFGVTVAGMGSIGPYSIGLLCKEFRERLRGDDTFDPEHYTLANVAERFRAFMFDEHFNEQYPYSLPNNKLNLSFIISGYSSGERLPETYTIDFDGISAPVVTKQFNQSDGIGLVPKGMPDAITRLTFGFSAGAMSDLCTALNATDAQQEMILGLFFDRSPSLIHPAMPVQDAIDLARFLVELTINYQRFLPDFKTVGGPIEIATITRYEGFKWVQRKHYYDMEFNP
jgi:hypothetical protein